MFNGDETGNQPEGLSRSTLGLEQDFFVRNELLRRGGDRTVSHNGHFWDFDDVRVWIVGPRRFESGQHGGQDGQGQQETLHRQRIPLRARMWTDETPTRLVGQSTHRLAQTLVAWRYL